MKSWHLGKTATVNLYSKIYELENRISVLEDSREILEEIMKKRWDTAVETLEQEIVEKCYIKEYNKDDLYRLLDFLEKK